MEFLAGAVLAILLCLLGIAARKSFNRRQLELQISPDSVNDGGAAAALAMAMAYRGVPVTQEVLGAQLWLPDGRTTARTLLVTARKYGLKARGVHVSEKRKLMYVPVGTILHRHDLRFQVFERFDGETVTVLDPFEGRLTVPLETFWSEFDQIALIIE